MFNCLFLGNISYWTLLSHRVSKVVAFIFALFFPPWRLTLIYCPKSPSPGFVQCVPLATEPRISLIIVTPMKILQRNLNRGTFVVWEKKRNVSVVCVGSAPNCCDTEQRSKYAGFGSEWDILYWQTLFLPPAHLSQDLGFIHRHYWILCGYFFFLIY
jgi:hypothetical protein